MALGACHLEVGDRKNLFRHRRLAAAGSCVLMVGSGPGREGAPFVDGERGDSLHLPPRPRGGFRLRTLSAFVDAEHQKRANFESFTAL